MNTMKSKFLQTLTAAAVCAVAAAAVPTEAADQPSGSTIKNRDSRSGSEAAANASSTSDRRLDFGKPVRFIRNSFSRDNDQNDSGAGMNRERSEEGRGLWRSNDDRDQDRSALRRENRDERDSNRLWDRGSDKREEQGMKKEEKQGLFSRILSWRPFSRDRDR
jgi:hypothetical protein